MADEGVSQYFVDVSTNAFEAAAQVDAANESIRASFQQLARSASDLGASFNGLSLTRFLEAAQQGQVTLGEFEAVASQLRATIAGINAEGAFLGKGFDQQGFAALKQVTAEMERQLALRAELAAQGVSPSAAAATGVGTTDELRRIEAELDRERIRRVQAQERLDRAEIVQTQGRLGGALTENELLELQGAGYADRLGSGLTARTYVRPEIRDDPRFAQYHGLAGQFFDVKGASETNQLREQQLYGQLAKQDAKVQLEEQAARNLLVAAEALQRGALINLPGGAAFTEETGFISKSTGRPITNALKQAELQQELERMQAGGSGFFGGFGRGITGGEGFGGLFGADFGEQAGFLFRYIAIYQGFLLVKEAIQAAATSLIEFESSVTNLNFLLQTTRDNARDVATGLGDIATTGGLNPSAGVQFGTQAARVFAGQGANEDLLRAGARAGTNLAVLTGTNGEEDLTRAIAVVKSFQLEYQNLTQVLDVATSAAQNFGFANAGVILPGLAQISDLAKESGFSLEQTANIIADITASTGQKSDVAAGELKRFLGKQGASTFANVFNEFGVDQTQSFADQIAQFAPIFQQLTQAQQRAVTGQFGGGRAGTAVTVLLQDFPKIQEGTEKSLNSAGLAQEQVNKRLTDLHGLIITLRGDFAALAKDLGESGLGAGIGVVLKLLDPLLKGVDDVLRAFTELSGVFGDSFRNGVIAAGEFLLVLRAIQATAASGLLGGVAGTAVAGSAVGGAAGVAATRAAAAEAAIVASSQAATLGAIGSQIGTAGAAGIGFGSAGAAGASPLLGPMAIAIGGLIAVGGLKGAADRFSEAAQQGSDALDALAHATTPDELKGVAAQAKSAAAAERQASSGFFGTIDYYLQGGAPVNRYRQDLIVQQQAEYDQRNITTETAAAAAALRTRDIFGPGNVDIGGGLERMTAQGITAVDQLHLLAQALGVVGATSGTAAAGITASTETYRNLANIIFTAADKEGAFREEGGIPGTRGKIIRGIPIAGAYLDTFGGVTNEDATALARARGATQIRSAVDAAAKDLGIESGQTLTPQQLQGLIQGTVNHLKDLPKDLRTEITNGAIKDLETTLASGDQLEQGTSRLTQSQLAAIISLPGFQESIKNIKAQIDPRDASGGEAALGVLANLLAGLIDRAGGTGPADLITAANQAEHDYIHQRVVNLEALRKSAQARANSPEDIKRIGQNALRAEIAAAIKDQTELVGIMNNANQQEIAIIVAEYNKIAAMKAAAAANEARLAGAIKALPRVPGAEVGLSPFSQDAQTAGQEAADAAANAANAAAAAARSTAPKTGGSFDLGDNNAASTAEQIAEARALAQAIPGSPVSQARAQLNAARIALNAAAPRSAEYYNALRAYHQAQYDYAQAQAAAANQAYLNTIDITNPVAVARAALLAANRQLARDRARGAPSDTIATDIGAQRTAQNQLENAAFQQRLQDAQTNHELGRISGEAYLRYLNSEHDRLTHIAHRTRQQQDELNQIDQLIKSANQELQGQFNIGEIKLPTIYEVRRAIQGSTSGAGGYYDQRTVSAMVNINGDSIANILSAVVNAINGELGTHISASSTYGRKT